MEKICNKCLIVKSIDLFNKKIDTKDGLSRICRECQKLSRNKEKDRITTKKWASENKQHRASYMREYRQKTHKPKKIRTKQTPDEKRKYNREYEKKRRQTDPIYKLSKNIRGNIIKSFKHISKNKNTRTQIILGCSYHEFKQHLEKQFEPWMNWDNYGKYNGTFHFGWDIDHVIPQSSAKTENELLQLNMFIHKSNN